MKIWNVQKTEKTKSRKENRKKFKLCVMLYIFGIV